MRKLLPKLPGLFFTFAMLWGILAGFIVFFGSGATSVSQSNGGPEVVTHLNWYEAQGWWGIAILFIFATLYLAPWYFQRRGRIGMTVLFSAAAIGLTIISGFSVGGFYSLGALELVLGLLLLAVANATRVK